ncbi:hypothetical protein [Methanosalsum natronophilum]|uniref:hypothetical protein n=1 Tax=Methanosalsum natronophilum TaxID=768733 RepID=UPI002168A5D4|nr:hypothetical protein [Methanosalsum natronophilum]MCS3923410.1 hypothetical protein [Methanosalsum natronophilum]
MISIIGNFRLKITHLVRERLDHFMVVSKSGFTEEARDFAGKYNILLYTLEDMQAQV